MQSHVPGGRFDADFETTELLAGIDSDLKFPVGTNLLWYAWDQDSLSMDPVYDVGEDITGAVGGRMWKGPYSLDVIRAVITQGQARASSVGYYNADELHLTLNIEDVERIVPGVIAHPDLQNRSRLIWKNQVYRPYFVHTAGIVAERYTLLVVNCIQIMPEEMVNDPQFLAYAS
ncbi:hypothetical protein UFOVP965_22 [uncultured Caudovirales phage]|uniref:Uncharacterized protein n=1 Tax=uncultured Caudovirales phage TaxID=2100421 RepID=A0A6J5QVW6_9CAUD|nr:hypothetical protein UFOVP965_22 [uncultured Caudovirales phage]CAB4179723.1 hypothetical protein UFOVP1035_18 [uncultured Caudovirales phage]CAB4188839.1 hypothetical protein UFOVP1181_124 [uncultured Caudovirales phage]